jgi:hypothetical protein
MAVVAALDDLPGRLADVGLAHQPLAQAHDLLVPLVDRGVERVEAWVPLLLAGLLDALLELGPRQVDPELEDQGAFVDQRLLEAHHVGQPPVDLGVVDRVGQALADRPEHPGPGVDGELASARKRPPIAPEAGMAQLFVGGSTEHAGRHVAGVHPLVEP